MGLCEFKDSLVYILSSRTASAIETLSQKSEEKGGRGRGEEKEEEKEEKEGEREGGEEESMERGRKGGKRERIYMNMRIYTYILSKDPQRF